MGSAERQGEVWSAGAREWSELVEPNQIPFYDAALDALGVGPGTTLLDAGCGAGLALLRARECGATPVGLDASSGLLAIARERLGDADLRQGEIEELPFDDHSFDAVSAFNSVQFAADPVRATSELGRVARLGAPVAIVTWGASERCEFHALLSALSALAPPAPAGAPGPFALSAPGAVEGVVDAAGLVREEMIEVPTPFTYASLEVAVRALTATGPGRMALEHAGVETTEAALREAMAPFTRSDGTVRTENVFRVLLARA